MNLSLAQFFLVLIGVLDFLVGSSILFFIWRDRGTLKVMKHIQKFNAWAAVTILVVLFNIVLIFSPSFNSALSVFNWDFSDESDFSLSSSTVQISGGQASLVPIDQTDDTSDVPGFASGTFSNTEIVTSSYGRVQLTASSATGTFTSRIIDAGTSTSWTDLEWTPYRPSGKTLPDNGGEESGYPAGNIDMSDAVLLLHMDETATGTYSNDAPTGDDPVCNGPDNCPVSTSEAIFGTALHFSPTGTFPTSTADAIIVSSSPSTIGASEMSFGAWVYRQAGTQNYARIMGRGSSGFGGINDGVGMGFGGPPFPVSDILTGVEDLGPEDPSLRLSGAISNNEWFHLVSVFDGNEPDNDDKMKLYFNGELSNAVVSGTFPNTLPSVDADWMIGGNVLSERFYMQGIIDEVFVFDRALTADEVSAIYHRGVTDMRFQVRSCDDSACVGESFVGPDGTASTFYSEIDNDTTSPPSFDGLDGILSANRYFQYQATLFSSSTSSTPQLSEVDILPIHYPTDDPFFVNLVGKEYVSLDSFSVSESGDVLYQISNTNTAWYYYDSSSMSWTTTPITPDLNEANNSTTINNNIDSFVDDVGKGLFHFRGFLQSDGLDNAIVSNVALNFTPTIINFRSIESSGDESNSLVTMNLDLSVTSTLDVTVDYSLSGSAQLNDDVTGANGTATILAGETSTTFSFSVVDDDDIESDELAIITISNPSNAEIGTNNSFTYTIINNDSGSGGGGGNPPPVGGGGDGDGDGDPDPDDPPEEGDQPPATFVINNDEEVTNSLDVILNIDAVNVIELAISNDPAFPNASFVPFANSFPWRLKDGAGEKTVYIRFATDRGVQDDQSDSINYVPEGNPEEPPVDEPDPEDPGPDEPPPEDPDPEGPDPDEPPAEDPDPDTPPAGGDEDGDRGDAPIGGGGESNGGDSNRSGSGGEQPIPIILSPTEPKEEIFEEPIPIEQEPVEFVLPEFIPNVISAPIEQTLEQAVRSLKVINEIADNPEVEEKTEKIVAPIVVSVTVAAVAPSIWSTLFSLLQYVFAQPLLLFTKRKRSSWGTVYNSLNKLPVDLALVRLIDPATNKVKRTRVTDLKGRYLFLANPGKYRIEVQKQGFGFPTQVLTGKQVDGDRFDIYHGQALSVEEEGTKAKITRHIPVDPMDVGQVPKRIFGKKYLRSLQYIIASVGLIASLISMFITAKPLIGIFIVVHAILFLVFAKFIKPKVPKHWGKVAGEDAKPLSNVVVRLFTKDYNRLVSTEITDRKGRYAFLVGANDYFIIAQKVGYEPFVSNNISVGKEGGVIQENIPLVKKQTG